MILTIPPSATHGTSTVTAIGLLKWRLSVSSQKRTLHLIIELSVVLSTDTVPVVSTGVPV